MRCVMTSLITDCVLNNEDDELDKSHGYGWPNLSKDRKVASEKVVCRSWMEGRKRS
jgi:hypothetical protein